MNKLAIMSVEPISAAAASAADRDYLIRRSMSTGYQYFSLVMPPLYTGIILARRRMGAKPWSINRMLRATWVGGFAGTSWDHVSLEWQTYETLILAKEWRKVVL